MVGFEVLFEWHGLGCLDFDPHDIAFHAAAVRFDLAEGVTERELIDLFERRRRIGKFQAFDLGKALLPIVGDRFVAEHDAQNTRCRGRVTVRVLARAHGDVERLGEIAVTIEERHDDIG